MLSVERFDDVIRARAWTRASASIGYEVSAYLVRGVLVDTLFPFVAREFSDWLRTTRVDGALLTHYHEDHAGNAGTLIAAGVPVGLPRETLERIRRPRRIKLYRRVCWGSAPPLPSDPEPFAHPALAAVPTPGHTTDHHVVWDAERSTVFGGDLFIGVKLRLAHPNEDIRGQAVQLRRVAALAPARFFDAHRGPLAHPVESLLAKAQWIDDVVGAVERRHRDGWSQRAIVAETLGRGDVTGLISSGEYAKRNLVASIIASSIAGVDASIPNGAP